MRHIFARFENAEDAADAESALRDVDLDHWTPDVENPFFDPSVRMPEVRGLIWGGLLGGLVGALVFAALDQHVFWIPRISPIMTAGSYALVFLGFGVGVASGAFLGGVVGTYRQVPDVDQSRLVVAAPDHRVGETRDVLRSHGATVVEDVVTHHEHPLRERATDSDNRPSQGRQ